MLKKKYYSSKTWQRKVHNNGDKNMGGLELLGFLAIVIGVIGLIVLLKSRKKSDR